MLSLYDPGPPPYVISEFTGSIKEQIQNQPFKWTKWNIMIFRLVLDALVLVNLSYHLKSRKLGALINRIYFSQFWS